MPAIGQVSPQPCPDCSSEMLWVLDSVEGEPDRRDHAGYRCANGHISSACTVCGSRNTTQCPAGRSTDRAADSQLWRLRPRRLLRRRGLTRDLVPVQSAR